MSVSSNLDEVTEANKNPVSDCSPSNFTKNDNTALEETVSSTFNINVVPSNILDTGITACAVEAFDLEKNSLNNASDSKKHLLEDNNNAISVDASNSEKNSLVSNDNAKLNVVSNSEKYSEAIDNYAISNNVSDCEKYSLASDSYATSNTVSYSENYSLADDNYAILSDVSDFEKKSFLVNNAISNNASGCENNSLTDGNYAISNDVPDSEKQSLVNSNYAISYDVPDSEGNATVDNSNAISDDTSDSGKQLLPDNKAISAYASDFEKTSLADNYAVSNTVDSGKNPSSGDNNEMSKDISDSKRHSLCVDVKNKVINDTHESEKTSLADNYAVSNTVDSGKNPSSGGNNEMSKDVSDSKRNSLTVDVKNKVINDAPESEKTSLADNYAVSNTVDSGKNPSSGGNNEMSKDISDPKRNSLSVDVKNKVINNTPESENRSNSDLNVNHLNDNVGTSNPESVSYSSHLQDTKSDEIRTVMHSFESKRQEYEEVLTQCRVNLEKLSKDNIYLRHEVADLKIKLNHKEVEFQKHEAKMKAEYLAKVEKLSRDCNTLRKEKEAIVIRYANSEKEVIMDKKIQQDLEKKIKDMTKDRECLILKLKNASSENSKLSSSIETKMVDIAKLQKENDKLNADFNSREIRIKWLQNKLKTEVTAHQETQGKLDHTIHRLNEMREEAEQVRKDCQEMIKCYQEAEEIKSVKLDSQLKQKLSELEVQKQEKCDQEQVYTLLRQELDALKKKQRSTMEDNNSLTLKINSLEKERLEYEQTLCKLKDNQNLLKEEIADLTSRLAEMEGLKLQLEQEREKSAASLREVERLRLTNAELQSDIDACHIKEGDRLDFVEKLTAKTMHLQSDHCLLEVKAQALEEEVNQLKKSLSEVQLNYTKLVEQHEDLKKVHESEMQLLVQKLAEKAKIAEKLTTRLEESENENRVLKRRHITSIKELSRELYQCKRRLESYESKCGIRTESVSLSSRTSSSASLHVSNTNEMCQTSTSPSVTFCSKKETPSQEEKNGSSENQFTVDKEVLIDRIIHLQKMLAKKTDKIDFLEDHIEHLVKEMRKKSKSVDFKNV